MIRILFIFFFFAIVISSCTSPDFIHPASSNTIDKNCNVIDSLSNDTLVVTYCVIKNENNEIVREGKFMNSKTAVGLHVFYERGKKHKIIQYIPVKMDSSYLNNVYSFYPNGDTNYVKSNFCLVNLTKNIKDSIQVNVFLKAPYWKNSEYEVFVILPNNDSIALVKRCKKTRCNIVIPYTSKMIEIIVKEFIIENSKTKERYYYFWEKLH